MAASYAAQLRMVFAGLRSNPDLRRVQLAFAGFTAVEWATWIAMMVYAYDHGGATAAGLVALAQLAPAVVFAPYAGALGDRHPRARVLAAAYAAQAASMAATAVVLVAGGPPGLAYGGAVLVTLAVTVTRPTQAALLPELARSPDELTAANVIAGWAEATCVLIAPALAGVLLGVSGPGAVFGVCAAVAGLCVLAVAPLARRTPARSGLVLDDGLDHGSVRAGLTTLRDEPAARLLVGLLSAQFVAIGALDVLYVVLAVTTLSLGESWAGYLNAAFGAGGALAILVTSTLVGRPRLMPPMVAGIAAWAAALALLAAAPGAGAALALLAVAGLARTLVDTAGRTLLQRAAPPEVLARVFGVLEALQDAALAAGSLLVPVLVALGGAPLALVGVAALLPLMAVLTFRRLRTIDAHARVPVAELNLLRCMETFAGLPAPALEGLARSLHPQEVAAGEVLIRQGDLGEHYYAISGGTLDVSIDGRHVTTVGRGHGVGEIALLREVPRTASVTARTDAHVYALEKAPFVAAVTGHAPLEHVMDERLAALRRA